MCMVVQQDGSVKLHTWQLPWTTTVKTKVIYVKKHWQVYTGWAKKVSLRCLHITSSNTGRFSKFFHSHILQEICNKAIIKYPTSPQTSGKSGPAPAGTENRLVVWAFWLVICPGRWLSHMDALGSMDCGTRVPPGLVVHFYHCLKRVATLPCEIFMS